MKRWYCPHCGVFKRTKKKHAGFMGYPDTHHCRCCGSELVNVRRELEIRDNQYILSLIVNGKRKCAEVRND